MRIIFFGIFSLFISFLSLAQENVKLIQTNEAFKRYMSNDKGIQFVQKDSLFSLQFQMRMQNRASYYSKSNTDFTPETFELRTARLRMKFKGFVYSPRITYYVQLGFSRGDLNWNSTKNEINNFTPNLVRDAIINLELTEKWSLGFGQTKLHGNRQAVISSGDQQFVDRSITHSTFYLDRDYGVFSTLDLNYVILKAAITSGEGRNSTKSNKGLSYTGRIEFLPLGKFSPKNDYIESDLAREPKPKLSIAGSYNYNSKAIRQAGQLGLDLYQATELQSLFLDVLFKYKGFAFYSEYNSRISNQPITFLETDLSMTRNTYVGYGNSSQMSYLFKNNFEIAARFSFVQPFKSVYLNEVFANVNEKGQEQIQIGVTKYLYGHRVKVQGNLTHQTTKDLKTKNNKGHYGVLFQFEVGI